MGKPVFVYTLACETCGETLIRVPTHQVVITEVKRDHARKHQERDEKYAELLDQMTRRNA